MKIFIYVANRNILHNELFGNYSTDEVHGIKKLMVQLSWGQDGTIFAQYLHNYCPTQILKQLLYNSGIQTEATS